MDPRLWKLGIYTAITAVILLNFVDGICPAGQTDVISQYDVTWYFDDCYKNGTFVNGDPWVLGPVTIEDITPAVFYDGQYYHNGWEVDHSAFTQAFDSRIAALVNLPSVFDLSRIPTFPKTVTGNATVIKAISREPYEQTSACNPTGGERGCLKTASVLTVLDRIPVDNGRTLFRPPYIDAKKGSRSIDELHLELLPSLSKSGIQSVPDMDALASRYLRLWMDHPGGGGTAQLIHCNDYMPGYGQGYGLSNAEAALGLMLDDPIEEKMPLLIGYVQLGIDTFALQEAGVKWPCDGGQGSGRLLPISFAAVMLDDPVMKETIISASPRVYAESSQVVKREDGVVLYGDYEALEVFGETKYWCMFTSCKTATTVADPCGYIDGGYPIGNYLGNTNGPWKYTALAGHIMPELKALWTSRYAIEFMDRYQTQGLWASPDPAAPFQGSIDDMGETYGVDSSTGECIPGSGRFLSSHGDKTYAGLTGFMGSMWTEYRTLNGPITYCGDNSCNGDEAPESCSYDCEETMFYVSPTGAGNHDGSIGNEFTLAEAQNYANAHLGEEITFLLAAGNYGTFTLTSPLERTSWATWEALDANNKPVFDKVYVSAQGKNLYIRFDSIKIQQLMPVPAPPADGCRHFIGEIAVIKGNNIRILNSELYGVDKYLSNGVDVSSS
ncbi:MAG: hypothetical protein JXB14_03675, partial [Candidatus Altiarchaeota archaeon]|nr:hypothetical protein [Candidatus Altiarchaeota archaeon]